MSLTRPLQHSDYCNWDVDQNSALVDDTGSSYGHQNRAERGPKWRLMMHKDDSGQLVRLSLALVTDAKAIYEANAAYRRNLKPVDPNEIVYPPCAFQREDGTWASWMEMLPALIRQWELEQVIDESSYPLVRRAA